MLSINENEFDNNYLDFEDNKSFFKDILDFQAQIGLDLN